MIGKSDERGSGISILAARHDDDDDDIYIYIYTKLYFYWTARFSQFHMFSSEIKDSVNDLV